MALAPRKRQRRRTQQVARWTRVKRLRGGRSHIESQMCLSKKPRWSSATRRRRKRRRATSPRERAQEGFQEARGPGISSSLRGQGGGALLAASTSFSTRPPLASVSTDSQSLTKKKVLRAVCRSLTMMCCRNQAGLSPAEGAGLSQGYRVPGRRQGGEAAGAHPDLCCRATHGSSTRCPGCVGSRSERHPGCCGGRLCPRPGAGGHSGCPPHTA